MWSWVLMQGLPLERSPVPVELSFPSDRCPWKVFQRKVQHSPQWENNESNTEGLLSCAMKNERCYIYLLYLVWSSSWGFLLLSVTDPFWYPAPLIVTISCNNEFHLRLIKFSRRRCLPLSILYVLSFQFCSMSTRVVFISLLLPFIIF